MCYVYSNRLVWSNKHQISKQSLVIKLWVYMRKEYDLGVPTIKNSVHTVSRNKRVHGKI